VKRKYLDIPYSFLSVQQKLDVYLPDQSEGPFPVILSIHGGSFIGGNKADAQILPMLEGLERGYAVIAVNYRLSWEAVFPAMIHDVKASVRWIWARAQRYRLDADRIAAWGPSVGGYLAAMLGTSAGVPELEDLSLGNGGYLSHVQAVVAWIGPTDFLKMDEYLEESGLAPEPGTEHSGPNSPESLLLGQQITEIPDRFEAANPETYITSASPPFFLQHGTMDRVVPVQMSIHLAAKLRQVIGDDSVKLDLLAGADHGDPPFWTAENASKVLDFLDRRIR
jgi:acetyl esterase/lipase